MFSTPIWLSYHVSENQDCLFFFFSTDKSISKTEAIHSRGERFSALSKALASRWNKLALYVLFVLVLLSIAR